MSIIIIIAIIIVQPEATALCALPLPPRFFSLTESPPPSFFPPFPAPYVNAWSSGIHTCPVMTSCCAKSLFIRTSFSLFGGSFAPCGVSPPAPSGRFENKINLRVAAHCINEGAQVTAAAENHGCARRGGSVCPWGYEIKGFLVVFVLLRFASFLPSFS